jgi:hypothetical protein
MQPGNRQVRGNGLRGMRERAAMLGGTLTAADRRPAVPGHGPPTPRGGPVTISVLLADDQPLVRTGLRTILEDAGGFAPTRQIRAAPDAPRVLVLHVRPRRVRQRRAARLSRRVPAQGRPRRRPDLRDPRRGRRRRHRRASATRRLVERFLDTTPESHRPRAQILGVLTDREREVLTLLARGATASRPSCWPTRPASSGRECDVNWAIRSLVVISARS